MRHAQTFLACSLLILAPSALRDATPEAVPQCAEARRLEPAFPARYEIPAEKARQVDFLEDFTLQESSLCDVQAACSVSLAPLFNASQPYESKAVVTVKADCTRLERRRQLFLCRKGQEMCLAALQLPGRPWRLRHLASGIVSPTRMARMDYVDGQLDFFLEGLCFLNVLVIICVLAWLLTEMILLYRRGKESGVEELDPHFLVPSSLEIMFEGMLDAACFIIGAGLLLLAGSTFLQKFGSGSNPADLILLCYPLLFGPAAITRIFLCLCRRLLYHHLFQKKVLLDFNTPSSQASHRDFLSVYTYLGFAVAVSVLIFDAVQSVNDGVVKWKVMLLNTFVFMSPLYYMVSSIFNSLRTEREATQRMCLQGLGQAETKETVETLSHQLLSISEGAFCKAARGESDLELCISQAQAVTDESGASFGFTDLFWVPRMVAGRFRPVSLLLVISMPLLMLLTMLLALASLAWLMKHRTDVPEIEAMTADVPLLTPGFDFEVTDYAIFAPQGHGRITFTATREDTTSYVHSRVYDGDRMLLESNKTTQEKLLTLQAVLHDEDSAYPTVVELIPGTSSQERHYRVTVLEVHMVIRSLYLHGVTEEGLVFERCLPWSMVPSGSQIAVPEHLTSLRMEMGFEEFQLGIPFNESKLEQLVPVYRKSSEVLTQRRKRSSCKTWCKRSAECFGYKRVSDGCYFFLGPIPPRKSCQELHAQRSQRSHLQITAKVCDSQGHKKCVAQNVSRGLLRAEINGLIGRRMKARTSLDVLCSLHLGNGFQEDLQSVQVTFIRGTVPLHGVVENAGKSDTRGEILDRSVLPDGRHIFHQTLIYNPRQELLSHAFDLYSFWGVILDDTDFEVHWHLPMKRIDPRFIYVFFHQACQTGAYWAFDVCGGYANSFIAEARVDAWYPVQKLRATVVSKSHPKLFRPLELEIHLSYNMHGSSSPLQHHIRSDCDNLPVCRAPELEACLDAAERRNCIATCKERCLQESMAWCEERETNWALYYLHNGSYQGRPLGTVVPFGQISYPILASKELLHWVNISVDPKYTGVLTDEVLVDVAEHCSIRSPLLSLLRPARSNVPRNMGLIMEGLMRNPRFNMNGSFENIPVLQAIFDDHREDFLYHFALPTVAIYRPALRPLILPVCLATDPASASFITVELMATVMDKLRAAVLLGDASEEHLGAEALHALSRCIKSKGRSFKPFPALKCRSQATANTLEDGSKLSFYSLAPTSSAFSDLLPVCQLGGPMEQDHRTILHLAAEKNFSEPMEEVLQRRSPYELPDVDAHYMSWHKDAEAEMRIQSEGCTALHAACRSGCGPCVEALLRHEAQDIPMNLSWFSATWDRAFHPWMLTNLAHDEKASQHVYDSIYEVLPIHVAAIHGCQSCVRALAKHSDIEAKLGVGNLSMHFKQFDTSFGPAFGTLNNYSSACEFRALDLAVLFNHSLVAETLLTVGASASYVAVDNRSTEFPVLKLLPGVRLERCELFDLTSGVSPASRIFAWI